MIDDSADPHLAPVQSSGTPSLLAIRPLPQISPLWLIVPCLACDFLMVPVISSLDGPPHPLFVPLALGIVGCVLAQGCLLAAFLAWSEGPFLRRLLVHWLIAAGLYLAWLGGLMLAAVGDGDASSVAASVALGVPLVSIGAQFPLWLARQFWGWRLVRDSRPDIPVCHPAERKLAIRDLLLATAVVAVALALARLAPLDGDDKDAGPVWLVGCTVACVISSLTMLPAGAWLMRPVGQTFLSAIPLRGLAFCILYAAAWIALVWIVVLVQWWFAFPRAPRAIYVGISSVIVAFAATVILTALLARSRGYRLTGGRKRLPHDL